MDLARTFDERHPGPMRQLSNSFVRILKRCARYSDSFIFHFEYHTTSFVSKQLPHMPKRDRGNTTQMQQPRAAVEADVEADVVAHNKAQKVCAKAGSPRYH